MKLTIFCNYLNNHQILLNDEVYKILGDDFRFVATKETSLEFLKGGEDYSLKRAYCIRAFDGREMYEESLRLARESDACVFGADSMPFALERAKYSDKISIEGSERCLKKGWINLLSPRLIIWLWHYHTKFKKLPWYRICSSAYTVTDDYKLHCYRDREYKWGYFINVNENIDIQPLVAKERNRPIRIMWCARFLKLKHPETVIYLAKKLKDAGYSFIVNMFGDDNGAAKYDRIFSMDNIRGMIKENGLENDVILRGGVPNAQIIEEMRSHDIFLMTSDKNEGWGVVVNEAMSNGCCVVANYEIGSVPYLVKDGITGCIFDLKERGSLFNKVSYLIDNPKIREDIICNAYDYIKTYWSPRRAAENLLCLIEDLSNNKETSIVEGPCSKAELL